MLLDFRRKLQKTFWEGRHLNFRGGLSPLNSAVIQRCGLTGCVSVGRGLSSGNWLGKGLRFCRPAVAWKKKTEIKICNLCGQLQKCQMPDIENSRNTAEKGAEWVTVKQPKNSRKNTRNTRKTAVLTVFRVFRVFFRLFFCCFAVTHSAPFSAVFRLFSMSGIWHLCSWPQRLQIQSTGEKMAEKRKSEEKPIKPSNRRSTPAQGGRGVCETKSPPQKKARQRQKNWPGVRCNFGCI